MPKECIRLCMYIEWPVYLTVPPYFKAPHLEQGTSRVFVIAQVCLIASLHRLPKSTVWNIIKKKERTSELNKHKGTGRPRKTSTAELMIKEFSRE